MAPKPSLIHAGMAEHIVAEHEGAPALIDHVGPAQYDGRDGGRAHPRREDHAVPAVPADNQR